MHRRLTQEDKADRTAFGAKNTDNSLRSRKQTLVTSCEFQMVCVTRTWDCRVLKEHKAETSPTVPKRLSFRQYSVADYFRIIFPLGIKHLVIYLLIIAKFFVC